jgi:hypothetical protein
VERFKGNDLMAVNPLFSEATAFGVLNNFLSEFHNDNGYALPSRYEVLISAPGGAASQNTRKINLRCESISMPGMNLSSTIDSSMYGVQAEVVDGVSFADTIAMTFQSSGDLEERIFFERWQEQAWDRETWNIKYYTEYTAPIDIYVLDLQNNKKYGVRLFDCYPKTIDAVPLSYATATDIIKINVSMQYRYWETLNITAQPQGLGDKLFDVIAGNIKRGISSRVPKVLSKLG